MKKPAFIPSGKKPRVQVSLPEGLYNLLCDWAENEGENIATLAGNLLCERIRQAKIKGEIPHIKLWIEDLITPDVTNDVPF